MTTHAFVLAVALALGIFVAPPAPAAVQLYTVTLLDPNDLTGSAIACAKAGGQGATLYNLDVEKGGGEFAGLACIELAKTGK